jgi:hypothetical protein
MHIQVMSATVGPAKAKSSPSKSIAPGERLFIRLRTHRAEAAGEFAAKRQSPGPRLDKPRPKLTDDRGRVYQSRDVLEVTAVEKERKSSVFPVAYQDEVLVFEAPSPGLEYLHLEVPAEDWGGNTAFRFTIPSAMIGSKRSGQTGSAGLVDRR